MTEDIAATPSVAEPLSAEEPVTFEEYRAALTHWREHDVDFGCSHGR